MDSCSFHIYLISPSFLLFLQSSFCITAFHFFHHFYNHIWYNNSPLSFLPPHLFIQRYLPFFFFSPICSIAFYLLLFLDTRHHCWCWWCCLCCGCKPFYTVYIHMCYWFYSCILIYTLYSLKSHVCFKIQSTCIRERHAQKTFAHIRESGKDGYGCSVASGAFTGALISQKQRQTNLKHGSAPYVHSYMHNINFVHHS